MVKTKIKAEVIADSKNVYNNRITTILCVCDSETLKTLLTHRELSITYTDINEINTVDLIKSVTEEPFIPIAWQKDHSGMQGSEYFNSDDASSMKEAWLKARDFATCQAKLLNEYNTTKQLCNKLLEPFIMYTVLITATEWENFFTLRCPQYTQDKVIYRSKKDFTKSLPSSINATEKFWQICNTGQAEIHMMSLVEAMWDAMQESTPKELKEGEWYTPFGDKITNTEMNKQFARSIKRVEGLEIAIKIATARCARVSYTVVGEETKESNYENDIKLHNRLAQSGHWSPFEHCAKAMFEEELFVDPMGSFSSEFDGMSDNFRGFIQYKNIL
jgi:hypothetical protein